MTINSMDVTLICLNIMGGFLLVSYLAFAYLVTHRGDFYHVRRWKAAFWVTNILGAVLLAFFLFSSMSVAVSDAQSRNAFEFIGSIVGGLFPTLTLVIPLHFVVAFGMHHQLKWWLNSDDFLDKIWKDPNKGHKSPVQLL